MSSIERLAQRLARPGDQEPILHRLLSLSASGTDISPACPFITRHILNTSAAQNPSLPSLAYDLLILAPSNQKWVETLASLAKTLSAPSTPQSLTNVALSKVPSLPHPALAHLALVATPSLLSHAAVPAGVETRIAAIAALASIALRERPVTAPQAEPLRLDALSPAQLATVRIAVSRSLSALVEAAAADREARVALAALRCLTEFASRADAVPQSSVLRATHEATAAVVWDLLLTRVAAIDRRFRGMASGGADGGVASGASGASGPSGPSEVSETPPVEGRVASRRLLQRRGILKALARVAAHAVSGGSLRGGGVVDGEVVEANKAAAEAVAWAVGWVDVVLMPSCDDADWRVACSAASAVLMVCSFCKLGEAAEKRARWGAKATAKLARVLGEYGGRMSSLMSSSLTKDACRAMAAMSKEPQVTSKFIVTTAVSLLPHAAACPRVSERLEALTLIASTVVEFDLSGRDANAGASLGAVTGSTAWKEIVAGSTAAAGGEGGSESVDSATAAEMVACFGQSLLDASQKIVAVADPRVREGLMTLWAAMLAKLLQRCVPCLSWPYSSASSFAKEMFLKMFEALGQYSAYLSRTRGGGMEEYERMQESLVVAALRQEDVNTRAALLVCVTKYWITSALKAEANAGHVLKAVWRHAQEHYRDEQVMLKELRTGALWSDARSGDSTPQQRATEGGYVSFITALTKRTKAVVDTVGGTFTEVLETTLFGSIALTTSAAEGSTLTTDFAYSSLGALIALVHRNPTFAEKAIALARQYLEIMDRAESADLLVQESVHNAINAMQMYMDEFFPKPVAVRPDMVVASPTASSTQAGTALDGSHPHAWLANVSQSCVFATSRLDVPVREAVTVSTEEAVLHASSVSRLRLARFHPGTLQNREHGVNNAVHGDQATLSGASDPFGVVAAHTMDTVKALATMSVTVVNRSTFHVSNVSLSYSAGGALTPLPDAATSHVLGSLAPGASSSQRVTLAVRHNQGFAGRVQFSVHVRNDSGRARSENGATYAEQSCLPYYIPSSDVLLLRAPPGNAGVDVFRRRWDLMREAVSFHVLVRENQDLDAFVDTLERRSGCLREVGRMRVSSHVSTMVADSSRGDYIALAALAPEAKGPSGAGPCLLYVTIRSNSAAYSRSFRQECRDWLSGRFKVIIVEDDLSQAERIQALHPQDAYFSNDKRGMSDYQRWRAAHAARMTCS